MQETRLSKFAVIKRLSLLCIFGHQLRLALSRGILVFRGPLIRPFDIYKHCIKLKVNKPCHWLAGFVYLLLTNGRVCLKFGARFLHVERPLMGPRNEGGTSFRLINASSQMIVDFPD